MYDFDVITGPVPAPERPGPAPAAEPAAAPPRQDRDVEATPPAPAGRPE